MRSPFSFTYAHLDPQSLYQGLGFLAGALVLVPVLTLTSGSLVIAQTPPDLNANPVISGNRIIRPTLRLGSQGESVKELQSMLILLGYYGGPVTGLYQEDTQLAVQRFQTAAGITADGIVGPTTWSQLLPAPKAEAVPPTAASPTTTAASGSAPKAPATPAQARPSRVAAVTPEATALPVLRPGMTGEAVRQLQQKLRLKGLYQGPVDGVFGAATEAAVRAIQQAHNMSVDGIVGPATWKLL
jgi:peptidoglycan hydrolase-like protein with peptidoglycan-binding domain